MPLSSRPATLRHASSGADPLRLHLPHDPQSERPAGGAMDDDLDYFLRRPHAPGPSLATPAPGRGLPPASPCSVAARARPWLVAAAPTMKHAHRPDADADEPANGPDAPFTR